MRFSTVFAAALGVSTAMAGPMFNTTSPSPSLTTATVMKRDLSLHNITEGLLSRVRSTLHLNSTLNRRDDGNMTMPMRTIKRDDGNMTMPMRTIKARSIEVPTLSRRSRNSTAFMKRGMWLNETAPAPTPVSIARRSHMANFSASALNATGIFKRSVALNSTGPSNVTLVARSFNLNSTVALKNTTIASTFTALKNKFFHKRSVRLQQAINWNSTHPTQF